MILGYKIVVATPVHRPHFLPILSTYIKRDYDLIDEWQLWLNTDDSQTNHICQDFVLDTKIKVIQTLPIKQYGSWSLGYFYRHCSDPNTIYIRINDDVVFLEAGLIEALVKFRIEKQQFSFIYANTINSVLCSHLHQRQGALPTTENKQIRLNTRDPIGWNDPHVAQLIHEEALMALQENQLDCFKFNQWILHRYPRITPLVFAFWGNEKMKNCCSLGFDEELALSNQIPKLLNQPNCILGSHLAIHFAYETQLSHLINQNQILDRYQQLAQALSVAIDENLHKGD